MNRIGKTTLVIVSLVAGVTVRAEVANSRYEAIVDRNIFRLTSPPPPPVAPTNTDALDKTIELSGISNIGGKKKAWFNVKAKGAKETLYVNLGENERQDFLEVISISEETGEVKILNAGSSMLLSFKNNAPKAAAGVAAPPPAPVAAINPVAPAAATYGNPAPLSGGSSVTVSGGTQIAPTAGGQSTDGGLRTIPTRALRLPITPSPSATQAPVDPVKQREVMEIQKAVYDAAGVPIPPLPPAAGSGGKAIPAPPGFPSPQ